MSSPVSFYRYQNELKAELKSIVGESPSPLYAMIRYHLGWEDEQGCRKEDSGGKLARPTLCLLACEAVGGDWHKALPAAAAVELLHNFSLIHDDIEDRSRERRQQPALWRLWGQAQGINAGDAMHTLSQLALLRLRQQNIPVGKILLASALLSQACLWLCEGQYLDIEYEGRLDVDMDDYLSMAEGKTAQLFECSLHLGALLGTDNEMSISHLCSFGRKMGLAYQIRNDLLDIWGGGEDRRRLHLSDIRQRKKTFPLIHALEKANGGGRERLLEIYRKEKISVRDAEVVLHILEKTGVRSYSEGMIERYHLEALKELDSAGLISLVQQELKEMAAFLLESDA
jgi:geranylgeranyl diphosphate synthase type I